MGLPGTRGDKNLAWRHRRLGDKTIAKIGCVHGVKVRSKV